MFLISFLTFALVGGLAPTEAWAWGPSTHIWIGNQVLSSLPSISQEAAALISAFRWDYLYGCISADILIGKNLADYSVHCHNWKTADTLLEKSRSDHHRAFVHGYMTHLAADVVSHNVFVPFQLINFFFKRAYKHTFWEYCVEKHVLPDVHVSFRQVFREASKHNNDLLEEHLTPTVLDFRSNRLFFSGVRFLDQFRRRAGRANGYLHEREMNGYLHLAVRNALQFLKEGTDSPQYKADPAGLENIARAREVRDRLREAHRGRRHHKRAWKTRGIHLGVHGLPQSPPYPLDHLVDGKITFPR